MIFFLLCILVTCVQIDIKSSLYNAFVQYKDKRHATKVFKWIFTALFRNRRFILDGIIQWIASEIFHALVYVTIDPQSIPKLPKIKNGKPLPILTLWFQKFGKFWSVYYFFKTISSGINLLYFWGVVYQK